MKTEQLYNIVIEHYKSKRDIEDSKPCHVGESGFVPMTLKEAVICKSKMSEANVCGMIRINKIVEVG